ncbi:MAG: hypothetical protein AABY22_28330 [Nanoarchaeota archaeon]
MHLTGKGCWTCGRKTTATKLRKSKSEFVKEAELIHGDKYDYSKFFYINNETKSEIVCKKCNTSFFISYFCHIRQKQGCSYCKPPQAPPKNSKPVYQINKDTKEIIRYFHCIKSATRYLRSLGKGGDGVRKCCHGKINTSGGFIWQFANNCSVK